MENRPYNSSQQVYDVYKEEQKKKKNRIVQRRVVIYGSIVTVLLLIVVYIASPISRVKTILIKGNRMLSNQEVLVYGNIKVNDLLIFVFTRSIEKNLEKNPFILEANVQKTFDRGIEITIVEKKIFTYRLDGEPMIYFFDGSQWELTEKELSYLTAVPYLNGFHDADLLEKVRVAFLDVDENIFRMISEIHEYATSYDAHMLRIVMQDGNQIFTSLLSLKSINYYLEILNNLKVENSCIFIDELSGSAFSMVCPEEKSIVEEVVDEDIVEVIEE